MLTGVLFSSGNLQQNITDYGNGTLVVSFNTTVSGNYSIVLDCTLGNFSGSPYSFYVSPGKHIYKIFRNFRLTDLIGAVSISKSTIGYPPSSFEVSDVDTVSLVIVLRDQFSNLIISNPTQQVGKYYKKKLFLCLIVSLH